MIQVGAFAPLSIATLAACMNLSTTLVGSVKPSMSSSKAAMGSG